MQLEYEFALEQTKPFLALVVTKPHHQRRVKKFGLVVDEREHEREYRDFKAIVTGKLCAFWNDTKDIRAAILQKLPEWEQKPELKGWVRGEEAAGSETLLDFLQVTVSAGIIDEWYRRAVDEILILGNDCKTAIEAKSRSVKAALDRGLKVKVICVNPDSPAAEMLPMVDPQFPTLDLLRSSLASVGHVMAHFEAQYPSLFEYRYLPIIPAFGLFITGPHRPTGFMKVELYASQPWDPVGSRPNIIVAAGDAKWRGFFLQQWENYWKLADPNLPEWSEYWRPRNRPTMPL